MNKRTQFICTKDEETRRKLLKEGLVEVQNSNGLFTFVLDNKKNFSVDESKIEYTNKMCI